ncbi:tetratricopeptide repeat protein [Hyphomicrobium sp.]|uniref:tetratricopeptide repeat protein n=1 Tax=Hyphomicrobium sp. TaxID=82 RepID=UPI0025B978A7|nr:tetratricopeptide repeat protein [Hyphomicrobium sp.]MCC7251107.1 tetratricopeptide repeat protein [Hyphomicrobium sp.]
MAADLDAPPAKPGRPLGVLAAVTASLLLGACAQIGGEDSGGLFAALTPAPSQQEIKEAAPSEPRAAAEYWSKQYEKNPRDLEAALSYAESLKALGQKREALAVLQQASLIHGTNRRLAADYGRLALELDQTSVAKKLLEVADDPANPDWRIVLARGTAFAKEGSYREAIGFYERAQALKPGHPSVLNNLALAYTMSGEPQRGEQLLRQASAAGSDNSKVRQNLALVLGLQGKYDEATQIGSVDLPASDAQANTALLRKMVKADPKSAPPGSGYGEPPAMASWAPAVAEAPAPVRAAPATRPALRASTIETGSGAAAADPQAASLFSAE